MSNLQQDLQRRFPQIADRFQTRDGKLTLLDNGVPVAVLLTPDQMEGLELTLELMADPEAVAEIREAEKTYRVDDVVEDEATIRKLIYHQSAQVKEREDCGMRFTVVIHEEDGGFWAEVPALPGCSSQGETLEEMIYNIKESVIAVLGASTQIDDRQKHIAEFAPGLGSKVEITI